MEKEPKDILLEAWNVIERGDLLTLELREDSMTGVNWARCTSRCGETRDAKKNGGNCGSGGRRGLVQTTSEPGNLPKACTENTARW